MHAFKFVCENSTIVAPFNQKKITFKRKCNKLFAFFHWCQSKSWSESGSFGVSFRGARLSFNDYARATVVALSHTRNIQLGGKIGSAYRTRVSVSVGVCVCEWMWLSERSWICNAWRTKPDWITPVETVKRCMIDRSKYPRTNHSLSLWFFPWRRARFAFTTKITREMTYFVWVEAAVNKHTHTHVEPRTSEPDGERQRDREGEKKQEPCTRVRASNTPKDKFSRFLTSSYYLILLCALFFFHKFLSFQLLFTIGGVSNEPTMVLAFVLETKSTVQLSIRHWSFW